MTQEDRDKFILMDADIKEIKQNQSVLNDKVEMLITKASQPPFTNKELLGILITVVTYVITVAFFISDISAMASSNKEKIENDTRVNEIILDKVNTIAIDVAVVKNEQKRLKDRD